MELLLLPLLLLLLATILFLALKLFHSKCSNSNLPPGHMRCLETLEFMSTGRKGIPEKFFNDRMSRHSPEIFKTSLIGEKTAVFCGAAGNKFLLSNENKLVKAWYPQNVVKIFPAPLEKTTMEETTKMRRFLPGQLQLRDYVGTMDAIAKEQMEAYGEEITILPLAKHFVFAVACRLFLSIDDPERTARFEKPLHVVAAGVFSLPVNLPGTNLNRAIRAAGLIRKELSEIIVRRKRGGEEKVGGGGGHGDLLDHLLTTTYEDGRFMSEPDIADKILGLLMASHDTTATVITFIVKYLAELPHVYDKVFKEQREIAKGKADGEMLNWDDLQKMKYSWNVACEAMRLAPPIRGTFREAMADFTYAGFSIPKGWKLFWSVNTTHKNPDYFEEPEKFDPSRYEWKGPVPYSYLPFGGGARVCPGKELARLMILVFMHNLVAMFTWEKLLPHENTLVDFMPIPANGLPIRMHRHIN